MLKALCMEYGGVEGTGKMQILKNEKPFLN